MLIPVLAVGVVGTCLGATATCLLRRSAPMIPARLAREIVDVALADRADAIVERDAAHQQAVEAHDAVGTVVRELRDTRIELELVEEQLALSEAAARGAQHLAQTWESRARALSTTLEERCGPTIIEPSDKVILFGIPGQGFRGFA